MKMTALTALSIELLEELPERIAHRFNKERWRMLTRPFSVVVMAGVCLVVGLLGIAGFLVATAARVPGTSPLAQMFTSAFAITYIATSVLVWRRSRLAAPAFLVALIFPVVVSRNIVPSGALLLPSLLVTSLVAWRGYGYLRRESTAR
jgi:hypothetical protein